MPPIKRLPVAAAGAAGRLAIGIIRLAVSATLIIGLLVVLDAVFLSDEETDPLA